MVSSINVYEFGSPQKPWRLIKNIWYKIFNRETNNSILSEKHVQCFVTSDAAYQRSRWQDDVVLCKVFVQFNVKRKCWSNTVSLNSAGNLTNCPQKHTGCYATSILRNNWVGPRQIEHYSHFKTGWTSSHKSQKMPYHESDLQLSTGQFRNACDVQFIRSGFINGFLYLDTAY
jgi:hypothetical protein